MADQTINSRTSIWTENFVICAIACGTIVCLSILTIMNCFSGTAGSVSSEENRLLAALPQLKSRQDVIKFPGAFEHFFSDHFEFRLPLIAARNWLAYNVFHVSTNPKVVIGKNDWLFYNDDGTGPAQLNSAEFTDQELTNWAAQLQNRKDFLNSRGIKYLFVIAPEKGSIYPEIMPDSWRRRQGVSRLEQLQSYLRLNTTVDFVDAKSLLTEAKRSGKVVYLPRDTHWNPYGAFLVSQEIFKHLQKSFPTVKPLEQNQFQVKSGYVPADLAKMLGLGEQLHDDCAIVVPLSLRAHTITSIVDLPQLSRLGKSFAVATDDAKLPKAFVLRDSFCGFLAPFLSEHFSSTQYHWTNIFQIEPILKQHPDVVINEVAERFLYAENCDHVPDFAPKRLENMELCTFANEIILESISTETSKRGMLLKLRWRSKKATVLDFRVALKTLNSDGSVLGGADYAPDFLQRAIKSDTEWVDNLDLPMGQIHKAVKLDISVYRPGQNSMRCISRSGENTATYITDFAHVYTR